MDEAYAAALKDWIETVYTPWFNRQPAPMKTGGVHTNDSGGNSPPPPPPPPGGGDAGDHDGI